MPVGHRSTRGRALASPLASSGRPRLPPAPRSRSGVADLGNQVLEAGSHLTGLNRGDVFVDQIDALHGATITAGRLGRSTASVSSLADGVWCVSRAA